jgi:hypothetical protein
MIEDDMIKEMSEIKMPQAKFMKNTAINYNEKQSVMSMSPDAHGSINALRATKSMSKADDDLSKRLLRCETR